MYTFSKQSEQRLSLAHKELQILFHEVIKYVDCTVLCSFRNQQDQDKAFAEKKSKLKWPNSKHNTVPSEAVDVIPYPVDWKNLDQFHWFVGFVLGVAAMLKAHGKMKRDVRSGRDWNRDNYSNDEKFLDLPHFELV